jgi:hypothetical protein
MPHSLSSVGSRAMQKFDLGRWKLNDVEIIEQCEVQISHVCTGMRSLDDSVDFFGKILERISKLEPNRV